MDGGPGFGLASAFEIRPWWSGRGPFAKCGRNRWFRLKAFRSARVGLHTLEPGPTSRACIGLEVITIRDWSQVRMLAGHGCDGNEDSRRRITRSGSRESWPRFADREPVPACGNGRTAPQRILPVVRSAARRPLPRAGPQGGFSRSPPQQRPNLPIPSACSRRGCLTLCRTDVFDQNIVVRFQALIRRDILHPPDLWDS